LSQIESSVLKSDLVKEVCVSDIDIDTHNNDLYLAVVLSQEGKISEKSLVVNDIEKLVKDDFRSVVYFTGIIFL
jgi:hypothetical protein